MISLLNLTALIVLFLFALLILFFSVRAKEKRVPPLRPIPAFNTLKNLMARTIEAGQRMHLALGTGSITNATTADTLAGITVLEYLAKQAAPAKTAPIITTADPTVLLLAQNTVGQAYGDDTQGITHLAAHVRWISPQPAAYAAGVMSVLALDDDTTGNVMVGHFGDEYLLMAETAHRQNRPVTTVAGTSDPNVLPFVFATSPDGLWGEEMFAAGAYLAQKTTHIGSLLAQDALRWGVGLVILGSVLLKAFGVL